MGGGGGGWGEGGDRQTDRQKDGLTDRQRTLQGQGDGDRD